MAEHSRFFDSIDPLDPDKVYTAEDFVKYLGGVVTAGVIRGEGNSLKVETSGSNMNTTVDTGIAYIEDRQYENDSKLSLTHEIETLGRSRIDRVVLRLALDMDARYIRAFVKKGVAGASPIPPPLTREGNVYELSLAQVKIIGGQTYINVTDITDERGNPDVSPWASSKILPNFNDSSVGQPNGIATLDETGSVPVEQLRNAPKTPLNDTLNSASTTEAATANAIKKVNDKLISSSVVLGSGATASGGTINNIAIGYNSEARSSAAMALGPLATASGSQAFAVGPLSGVINAQEGQVGTTFHAIKIQGSLQVSGSKNFEIPHPHPDKRDSHVIRHGAVESPTAGDTLYRYTIEATTDGETVEFQLPDYFQYLNKDVDVWINGDGHFGRAFGRVEGDTLYVTCELAGTYKALVIGTRNDDHESVQTWDIRGVEREIGESWTGETYSYEVDEIVEIQEITQGVA